MKKSYVIIIAAWVVLLGALIFKGVSGETDRPKYGSEDALVGVDEGVIFAEKNDAAKNGDDDTTTEGVVGAGSDSDTGTGENAGNTDGSLKDNVESNSNLTNNSDRDNKNNTNNSNNTGDNNNNTSNNSNDVAKNSTKTSGNEEGISNSGSSDSKNSNNNGGSKNSNTNENKNNNKPTTTPAPTAKPEYTFTIQCKKILNRQDLWCDGLEEFIPKDGVFYSGKLTYKKGQSVYDALKSICEKNNILMDSRYTPIYETYYVSGIGNLYEFDCGAQSGWKYSVNGVLPGVGSSRYTIKKGDEIVFFYDITI